MARDEQFILNGESLKQLDSAINEFKNRIQELCKFFEDDFIAGCRDCMIDEESQAILNKGAQIPATLRAIIAPTTCVEEKLAELEKVNQRGI